jgi:hypothetical protein
MHGNDGCSTFSVTQLDVASALADLLEATCL